MIINIIKVAFKHKTKVIVRNIVVNFDKGTYSMVWDIVWGL